MNLQQLMPLAYCNNISVLELTQQLCLNTIKNGIPGDFCEAGIAAGAHCIIMNQMADKQKIYAFDSFEGIPTHTDADEEWTETYGKGLGDPRVSGGITVCPLDGVKETILRHTGSLEKIVFCKGWFVDTLPALTNETFSILRLDCDLYESYMCCFKYLLPRLSKGGWLIIDDIALSGCKKAIVDARMSLDQFELINDGTVGYMKWNK